MRRFRKWQAFLRILHLWGSFQTLMTSICKIQMTQVFGVKKCGKSENHKHFWEFRICGGLSGLWWLVYVKYKWYMISGQKSMENPNLNSDFQKYEFWQYPHFFSLKSCIICVLHWLSLKSGKTPTNSKFTKMILRFGISAFFSPENMYHLYFA